MSVARVSPCPPSSRAGPPCLNRSSRARRPAGTTLGSHHQPPRLAPTRPARPLRLGRHRTRPTDARDCWEPAPRWFWKKCLAVSQVAQPNGMRLSSAALIKDSFHNPRAASASAACYAGAQPISNPLSSPLRRLRLGCDESVVLATRPGPCPVPGSDRYSEPRSRRPVCCQSSNSPSAPTKDFAVRRAQHNGPRLSCGALKKDSFHNLRAPPASSAC